MKNEDVRINGICFNEKASEFGEFQIFSRTIGRMEHFIHLFAIEIVQQKKA